MAEIKRQVAVPLRIKTLKEGQYVKQEGWDPNYVQTKTGQKASRVNIMGVLVSPASEDSFQIDDGTAVLTVRQFDANLRFTHLKPGDPVTIIGRPREYERQIYVIAETVKKIKNPLWLKVRAQQLPKEEFVNDPPSQSEEFVPSKPSESTNFRKQYESIYQMIKQLDNGSGADVEEVLQAAGAADAEQIIQQLILEGEVFELSPGKLKILN